ncbi:TonB-dependent receptor plug domain-containing protein [Shivajiella indica]|uniref:TonB-dependent receptor plug domain-containing protein n=1 Tax=Shivajiella indica TaxID=872115 RepID=A0ABW5BDY2_9BACT
MLRFLIIFFNFFSFALFLEAREVDSVKIQQQKLFNEGLILSLPQAIQGQIPGLLVSRPGSNPNGNYDMIYRGYHTFKSRMQPLLMIDGMPGLSWHLVDPYLIDSIGVRRGSQLAQMGLQAAAGVFDASVSKPLNSGLSLSFLQNISMENYQRAYNNLSAKEFRTQAPPGTLFGESDTDWLEALTRTAWSTNTGLKLGYQSGNLTARTILSHRKVESIQRQAGFRQLSLFGALDYSFLNGKINAGASTLLVSRNSELGNTDFFQAAVAMNPTLGLEDPTNYFNRYGGNPKVRMKTDENSLSANMNMVQGYVTVNPLPHWTVKGRIGYLETNKNQFQLNGILSSSNDAGTLERNRIREDDRTFLELTSDYLIQIQDFTLNPGMRFTSQKISYDKTGSALIRSWQSGNTVIEEQTLPHDFGKYTLNAMGFFIHSDWKEKLYFDFLLQPEGAANLGENAGWGNFFGWDLKYRLNPRFLLFTSYSHTGMIPDRTGLSKTILQIEPFVNFTHFANPDMKWEDTFQWEIGGTGNFLRDKIYAEFRLFISQSSDFINLMQGYDWDYTDWNAYYPFTYQNFGAIRNQGTEWILKLNPVNLGKLSYQSSINATFIQSEWTDLEAEFVSLEGNDTGVSRGIGGNPLYQYSTIRTGESIGTARALEYLGIDRTTGQWILQQSNNPQDWRSDYVTQGKTIPRWWMGWNHQLQWKKWHLDAFFRGVFGHINANETNLMYGGVNFSNQNVLRSYQNLQDQGLKEFNRFSSYFIENSGFLSLHYLTISRDLDFLIRNKKISSTLSLIANNLFYITSYSAPDPEARLSTRPVWQMDEHIDYTDNYFSSGIDGASTWLPSRAFTVSFQLRF